MSPTEPDPQPPPAGRPPTLLTFPSLRFTHRLTTHSLKPNWPVQSQPQLAWLSLQGRLVGAEEATSARAIGGELGPEEAVAWELFSPMQRVLIVAVVAVAVGNGGRRDLVMWRLREAVRDRDEMLSSMQQKLDHLNELVNKKKDQSETRVVSSVSNIAQFSSAEESVQVNYNFSCNDYWLCEKHRVQPDGSLAKSNLRVDKCDTPQTNVEEQEERRLSDLSDWASSSAASAVDVLLNNRAIEQDVYNAKREAEEKDVAIKELSAYIVSKDKITSKRIEELEDIIQRKNMIISKQRKDIAILGQKVMQLTRLKRPSFSGSNPENEHLPKMIDNLLFVMESTTSFSSDSDCSPGKSRVPSSADIKELVTSVPSSIGSTVTEETSIRLRQISARPTNSASPGKCKKASTVESEGSVTSQVASSETGVARGISHRKRQLSAHATDLDSSARTFDQNLRPQRSVTMSPVNGKSTMINPITGTSRRKQLSAGGDMIGATKAGVPQHADKRKKWAR